MVVLAMKREGVKKHESSQGYSFCTPCFNQSLTCSHADVYFVLATKTLKLVWWPYFGL